MKLNVIIDVALLGEAHRERMHARGVHRVAEQIVSGLVESNECEIRYVATSNLAASYQALESRGLSPAKQLFYRPYQMLLSRRAEKAFEWVRKTLPDRRFHRRAARLILQRFAMWANASARHIPASALRAADIYHSPLAPIPKAARASSALKKFLTIVDVIPLTNPTSVAGKGVPLLKRQLASLDSNSFVFCISETVKSELLQIKNIPAQHVFITMVAASKEIFHPVTDREEIRRVLSAHGIPDRPYFLTLSSFDPRKNFDHIIRCFGKLLERNELKGCNLVIVGSNPERNAFVERARAIVPGGDQRILTPGFIPDHDLAAIYSGALAFLFPSLSEGFGMPALEAMQCGTPVICSNAPALPEVMGDAGILLEPRDEEAWCSAMQEIAGDPDLREKLGMMGRQRAGLFSWSRFIESTLLGYRQSLH
jgi:glycosyltransferase involved in cell wall biosynthesis